MRQNRCHLQEGRRSQTIVEYMDKMLSISGPKRKHKLAFDDTGPGPYPVMKSVIFKSNNKNWRCLLSNFYGGAEIDYMKQKFPQQKVKDLLEKWKTDIKTPEQLNHVRYQLEKMRFKNGELVAKGGNSGALYTDCEKQSYVRRFGGGWLSQYDPYLGTGILAKLAASTWKKEHKDRIGVLKHLAGLEEKEELKNQKPDPDLMPQALKTKFEQSPYRELLLLTGNAELAEQDGRGGPNYWTKNGENSLGKMLMELRTKIQQEEEEEKDPGYLESKRPLTKKWRHSFPY